MKSLLTIVLTVVLYSAASAQAPRVTDKDLIVLEGKKWMGQLTYLDYKSNKPTTIPSHLLVTRKPGGGSTWLFAYEYPDEPKANQSEEAQITDDGSKFFGEEVVENKKLPDGSVRIVTTKRGTDNNRPALFRYTYLLSAASFSVKKEVRVDGSDQYFERNTYSWTR